LQGVFGGMFSRPGSEQSRILDMVEQGKITADEGARLLSALPSPAGMLQTMSPDFISQLYWWKGGKERQVRLRITDRATGELKAEMTLSSNLIESGILALLKASNEAKTGKIGELDADPNARIELFVDDEPADAPSGE
jgi:hypothetical protein